MNSARYNKLLSEQERREYCQQADNIISDFIESINILCNIRERLALEEDEWFKKNDGLLISLRVFVSYCYCDIVVLTKQFILATHYYEKAFTYGKLKVVLNESFKKLYGFTDNAKSKSYFAQLKEVAAAFPQFNNDIETFSTDLETISNKNTWWKEERDAEVHMDVEMLDKFRNEDIYESQVIQEINSVLDIFDRVALFASTIHKTIIDFISIDELPTAL